MNTNLIAFLAIALAALVVYLVAQSLRGDNNNKTKHHHPHSDDDQQSLALAAAAAKAKRAIFSKVSQAEYESRIRTWNGKTLLFVQAPWCGYCQKLKPVLYEIAAKLPADWQVLELNADEAKQAVAEFKTPFPTLILFKDTFGQKGPLNTKTRLVGNRSAQEVVAFLGL